MSGFSCFDCDVEITPFSDPAGILYVRVVVDDKLIDVTVCETDWLRRENPRVPVRKRWPLSIVYTCPSCGAKTYNSFNVSERYCETCRQFGQWHVENCYFCALLLMPAVTPLGVIHVRKSVGGRSIDIAVCESDWTTHYRGRLPTRRRWVTFL